MPSTRAKKYANVDIDFPLRRIFGKTNFRPHQREIITAALEGNDVFVQAGVYSVCIALMPDSDLYTNDR